MYLLYYIYSLFLEHATFSFYPLQIKLVQEENPLCKHYILEVANSGQDNKLSSSLPFLGDCAVYNFKLHKTTYKFLPHKLGTVSFFFSFNFYFTSLECLACMYVNTPMQAMPTEARGGRQNPWNLS